LCRFPPACAGEKGAAIPSIRIEADFNRLEDFRCIAVRYDKLARNISLFCLLLQTPFESLRREEYSSVLNRIGEHHCN